MKFYGFLLERREERGEGAGMEMGNFLLQREREYWMASNFVTSVQSVQGHNK